MSTRSFDRKEQVQRFFGRFWPNANPSAVGHWISKSMPIMRECERFTSDMGSGLSLDAAWSSGFESPAILERRECRFPGLHCLVPWCARTSVITSILIGTSGLAAAGLAALWLTLSRCEISPADVVRVRMLAGITVLAHAAHFSEEYYAGFYIRFPELFGLGSWPASFFIVFNGVWVAIWLLCIAALARLPRVAVFPIWFLGIASAANGLIHPILAVAVDGYFPGLWSSPFVGILGLLLLRRITSATRCVAA